MDHLSCWWLCLGLGINGLSLPQTSSHSKWIIVSHCHRLPCTALYCDSLSNFNQQSRKLSASSCIIPTDCKEIYENKIQRNNAPVLSWVVYTKLLIALVKKKKKKKGERHIQKSFVCHWILLQLCFKLLLPCEQVERHIWKLKGKKNNRSFSVIHNKVYKNIILNNKNIFS